MGIMAQERDARTLQRSTTEECMRLTRQTVAVALCGLLTVPAVVAGQDAAGADRAFWEQNAKTPGVVSVSGLQYTVLRSGPDSGQHPTRNSAVKVRYEGRYTDGRVFDALATKGGDSTTIFPLRALIPGYQAALLMMRRGDKWRIVVPPEFGYGSRGSPLAERVITFELELVDFAELPPPPPPMLRELPPKPSP
jgi:FKBP-type peptidyl-prolyl cis-trans isomerase